MADEQPHLRAVGADSDSGSGEPAAWAQAAAPAGRRTAPLWIPILLALLLVIALGLALYGRAQLTGQIAGLEDEVKTLERAVERRDQVIGVHRARIEDVRQRVEALQGVLAEPLPEAE